MTSLLDHFGEVWEETTPEKWSGEDLPDGKYTVRVDTCVLKETKETKKPMIVWDFIVRDGEFTGRHIFHNRVLDIKNPDSIKYARADFQRLGIEINKPSEFTEACKVALDKVLEVEQKTKNGYVNIYFRKEIKQNPAVSAMAPFDTPF